MAAKGATLPTNRARLHELDTRGWPAAQIVDYRLIEAEMNGLDFDLTVRQPWARDPSFYATVFGERSDRSEEHTSELQSHHDLVCRLLLEKKKKKKTHIQIIVIQII